MRLRTDGREAYRSWSGETGGEDERGRPSRSERGFFIGDGGGVQRGRSFRCGGLNSCAGRRSEQWNRMLPLEGKRLFIASGGAPADPQRARSPRRFLRGGVTVYCSRVHGCHFLRWAQRIGSRRRAIMRQKYSQLNTASKVALECFTARVVTSPSDTEQRISRCGSKI